MEQKINSDISLLKLASTIHQPLTLSNLKRKAVFLAKSHKYKVEITAFLNRMDALDLKVTPEMLGVLGWPYLHNQWDVSAKLNNIALHYEVLSSVCPAFMYINTSSRQEVANFSHLSNAVTIEVDYASWFTREGEILINIFQGDLRVASMAFLLGHDESDMVAYVGAVQGIHGGISAEESLEIFKALTKDFFGLRPRSLLLEVLKVVVTKLGAKKIFGISEQHRHHRHPYFSNDEKTVFKNDYNIFWEEHGGRYNHDIGFYEISTAPAIKGLSEISSKKRSQYRKRYAIIESLDNAIDLSSLSGKAAS